MTINALPPKSERDFAIPPKVFTGAQDDAHMSTPSEEKMLQVLQTP